MKNPLHRKGAFEKSELALHKQVWLALADTYLDRDMSEQDWQELIEACQQLGASVEKWIVIDLLEVYPVLGPNLRSVAGIWTGFEEEEVVQACQYYYRQPWNKVAKLRFWWRYLVLGRRYAFWQAYFMRTTAGR